jgi:hypothetical protein
MKGEIYTTRQSCLALKIVIRSVNEPLNEQFMTALCDYDMTRLKQSSCFVKE